MAKLASISALLLLSVVIVLHFTTPSASADLQSFVYYCDNVSGNYTSTSTYKTNLDSVLTKMTSTDLPFDFYSFSADQTLDAPYLISMCTGNLAVSICHRLIAVKPTSETQINVRCPTQKIVILWSDDCMVRYSNVTMFEILDDSATNSNGRSYMLSDNTIFDAKYNQVVNRVVGSLPSKASAGNSSMKFATRQAEYNSSITIYSAAQCTPDLSQQDCLKCLDEAVDGLESVSSGIRGARYLLPSCNVRYEEWKFYTSSAVDSVLMAPSSTPNGNP